MKVWLVLYDVDSKCSNGYAVISANTSSLVTTIFKSNGICRDESKIIAIKEIGETDTKQLSILSEGITSLGEQGIQGILGPKGDKGDTGDSIQGPKGDTGIQGPIGPQGLLGIQGIQGIQGIKGEKGDSFTFEDLTLELINQLALPALDKINEMNWSLYKRRIDAMYNWCVRYGMEPVN